MAREKSTSKHAALMAATTFFECCNPRYLFIFILFICSLYRNSFCYIFPPIPEFYPTACYRYSSNKLSYYEKYEYLNNLRIKESFFGSDSVLRSYITYIYNNSSLLSNEYSYDNSSKSIDTQIIAYNNKDQQINFYWYRRGSLFIHDSTYYPTDTIANCIRVYPTSSLDWGIRIYNSKKYILIDSEYNGSNLACVESYYYKNDTQLTSHVYESPGNTEKMVIYYDSLNRPLFTTTYYLSPDSLSLDTTFHYFEYNLLGNLSKLTICNKLGSTIDTTDYNLYKYEDLSIKPVKFTNEIKKSFTKSFIYIKYYQKYPTDCFLLNGKRIQSVGSNFLLKKSKL